MKSWIQFTFAVGLIVYSLSTFAQQTPPTFGRLVSFGDSLSDLGTYGAVANWKGGGKFTTNPGKIWVEVVADKFGLPAEPNRQEGFGLPLRELGGFNYAQGGARIVLPYQKLDPQSEKGQTLSARPVAEQVGIFISKYHSFNPDDLVLIQGGANDVLAQAANVHSQKISVEEALKNIAQAADDLSMIVANLQNNGAQKIILVNLPAIEQTPRLLGSSPEAQALVMQLVNTFNSVLQQKTFGLNAVLVDLYHFDLAFNQDYVNLGFIDIAHPACRQDNIYNGNSLFCNARTLVRPDAALKYKYADELHPTTGFSKMVGDFVYGEILK